MRLISKRSMLKTSFGQRSFNAHSNQHFHLFLHARPLYAMNHVQSAIPIFHVLQHQKAQYYIQHKSFYMYLYNNTLSHLLSHSRCLFCYTCPLGVEGHMLFQHPMKNM